MAPIINKATRTVYYPAPKCASVTLRELYFEIENGYPFRRFTINGEAMDLFWLYGHGELFAPIDVPPGHDVIAVVRDPVDRFLSFYRWGVIDNHCNFESPIEINDFVANFATLLNRTAKIRFHLSAQLMFIGTDLSRYDRIFRIEELADLERYLSERSQTEVRIRRLNTSTRQSIASELTPASRARLVEIYREDYDLLKDFYSPGG